MQTNLKQSVGGHGTMTDACSIPSADCRRQKPSETARTRWANRVANSLVLWLNAGAALLGTLLVAPPAAAQPSTPVNWTGGNLYKRWDDPANWDKGVVPLNGNGTTYTVIVPANSSISYLSGGAGTIEALSFGDNSVLDITDGNSLEVSGVGVIRGLIQADGPGSGFSALGGGVVLEHFPRFAAKNGAAIGAGSSIYSWSAYNGNAELILADGTDSSVELPKVSSFAVAAGSGARTYTVRATEGGLIDLSGVGTITGPGGDDWLQFNLTTGGHILLNSLQQVSGQVRFNVLVPTYDLGTLQRASATEFVLGSNVTVNLSRLISLDSGKLSLDTGSQFNSESLGSISATSIMISDGSVANVSGLTSLDDVQLTLTGNGVFLATNLAAYRNSYIPVTPDRDLRVGDLTDVYGSRLSVDGGITFHVAAVSYDTPAAWQWYGTLFSAAGAGSLLDLSSLRTLRTQYCYWPGYDYRYQVTADNFGVVDLSGLQSLTGPDRSDRLLEFNIQNNGDVRLSGLQQISQYVRFNVALPKYELPALESADHTRFNLADGTVFEAPSLRMLTDDCAIGWGFNSEFKAANLRDFEKSTLSLSPGRILTVPGFTNVYGARFQVSGGQSFHIDATSYDTPAAWQWYGTLFSAAGAGSLLDLSSLRTLRTQYCYWPGYDYRYQVTADNFGVVDLSGLQSLTGPDRSDRLLEFNIQNNGDVRLSGLQQISQYVRFNVALPKYELPALELADHTRFNLADGTVFEAPSLRMLTDDCAIGWGFNSEFKAANLRDFEKSTLSLSPGRILTVPGFTNVYGARFQVSGGQSFHIDATSYDTPAAWQWYGTLFSAAGAGSLLDLSSLRTLRTQYCYWPGYDYRYQVTADNFGVVDLSGLQSLTGPDRSDRLLEFTVSTGGTLLLGNLELNQYANIQAFDNGSEVRFQGLRFHSPAGLIATGNAHCRVQGDMSYDHSNPNSIVIDGAYFQMDGTQPQRLEVGGKDLGPAGATTRNFGYSQLIVGETNRASVVRLVDAIDNGQRGAGGDPECLYLYGMDGAGLRLLNRSRLILNGLKVYALVNGQMQSLASLIPAGTNSAPFDAGLIALTGGPKITNMVPAITVLPPVSSVEVAFDIPVVEASFTPADVTITGPGGGVQVTDVAKVDDTHFRLSFPAQTVSGVYTVRVGPGIDELASNLLGMDQDGDGLSGEATADVFEGTFMIDGNAPEVLGAFALSSGTRIGVTLDEEVPESTAANADRFAINGVAPSSVSFGPDRRSLILRVEPLIGVNFSLTVDGLEDLVGNRSDVSYEGTILEMKSQDIGNPGSDPREPGSTVPFGAAEFDMVAGGSTIWNAQDAGHFAYESRTGDFDVAVRIAGQTTPSQWAQAGIMARPSMSRNSRCVFLYLHSHANVNAHTPAYRPSDGANMALWPNQSNTAAVNLPNAWMRLRRQGDVFTAYRSDDGQDWTQMGQITQALPEVLLVGPASSANNNSAGQTTQVQYRDYQDLAPSIARQPQSQQIASGTTGLFGVTAYGQPPLSYQWYHDGEPIEGATGALLEVVNAQVTDVGDYTVSVSNTWGDMTSKPASLTVDGVGVDGGLEADVSPSTRGDGTVTIQDWVKAGLLVAALAEPVNSSEFQRADCAPAPCGDGRLSVADWTQAGLYAAALVEPIPTACGPTAAGLLRLAGPTLHSGDGATTRLFLLQPVTTAVGQSFEVRLMIEAGGTENAVGCSVSFDPATMQLVEVLPGSDASDGFLQVNQKQAAGGRVGIALAKGTGGVFPVGVLELVRLRFVASDIQGISHLEFGDQPIVREVVDPAAAVLEAAYEGATIEIVAGPRLAGTALLSGGGLEFTFAAEAGTEWVIEVSTDLKSWSELARRVATGDELRFADENSAGQTQRFYRLRRVE